MPRYIGQFGLLCLLGIGPIDSSHANSIDLSAKQMRGLASREPLDISDASSIARHARRNTGFSLEVKGNDHLQEAAREAAKRYGIPEWMFLRLVTVESAWQQHALSPKGAVGLTQLMPGTATELGVDPYNPAQNLDGGARYLRQQFVKFGRWDLALAAYNAGPGSVAKYGGIPPFGETRRYINKILGRMTMHGKGG